MSDAIDRAAEVLAKTDGHVWECMTPTFRDEYGRHARALADAGLLADRDMERRFAEFLCEMTGGLLSKTGYDVRTMVQAADDYYERCRDQNDAEVAAQALRDAADLCFTYAWQPGDGSTPPADMAAAYTMGANDAHSVVDRLLHDLADQIEAGESDA